MKFSRITDLLQFANQHIEEHNKEIKIITALTTSKGYRVIHTLTWKKEQKVFFCETAFVNKSSRTFELKMLSSNKQFVKR